MATTGQISLHVRPGERCPAHPSQLHRRPLGTNSPTRVPLDRSIRVRRVPIRNEKGQQRLATDRRIPVSRLHGPLCRLSGGFSRVVLHQRPADRSMLIGDRTMTVLHSALTGVAERSRGTADHIANVNPPGFFADRTDFETALKGSAGNGRTPSVSGGSVAR